ncbi:MAG: MBL fold metallo-hydrolase [Clostridia bacterium]
MRYCSVASGSNGNCHYIESGEYRILVDLGLSARQIEDGLKSVGIDPASINGIFVTHEHSDHIRGIGVWARRYKVPILATAGTWKGMERSLGPVSGELAVTIRTGKGYRLGDMRIEAFSIYHDANEPVGYCFESGGRKIAVMTDTGMVTSDMKHRLMDCDLAVVESNHDVDMLMHWAVSMAFEEANPKQSGASLQRGLWQYSRGGFCRKCQRDIFVGASERGEQSPRAGNGNGPDDFGGTPGREKGFSIFDKKGSAYGHVYTAVIFPGLDLTSG